MLSKWVCTSCGQENYSEVKPTMNWSDGHRCVFVKEDD